MPRNVRNFWLIGDIDGKAVKLTGGPKQQHGGMKVSILRRDRGEVSPALVINCYCYKPKDSEDRQLKIVVRDPQSNETIYETECPR